MAFGRQEDLLVQGWILFLWRELLSVVLSASATNSTVKQPQAGMGLVNSPQTFPVLFSKLKSILSKLFSIRIFSNSLMTSWNYNIYKQKKKKNNPNLPPKTDFKALCVFFESTVIDVLWGTLSGDLAESVLNKLHSTVKGGSGFED